MLQYQVSGLLRTGGQKQGCEPCGHLCEREGLEGRSSKFVSRFKKIKVIL